jgi:hypothetical protein
LASFQVKIVLETTDSNTPAGVREVLVGEIPDRVKALDGKKVAIKGFQLPMKNEGNLVTEFLLLQNQSLCCFGVPPRANQWVYVRMTGKGVRRLMDQPLTFCGTLHVGEYREGNRLRAIYRMDGERMEVP